MKIDDKIRDEKLQYDINKEAATLQYDINKYQHYHLLKLIYLNILKVKKYYLLMKVGWQNKLSLLFFLWEKLLKKQ